MSEKGKKKMLENFGDSFDKLNEQVEGVFN